MLVPVVGAVHGASPLLAAPVPLADPGAGLLVLPVLVAAALSVVLVLVWGALHVLASRRDLPPDGASRWPSFRRHVVRPAVLLLVLAAAPWTFLTLVFPWRTQWGDAVLVDLGPHHLACRFEYEFGDVPLRDGAARTWLLPRVPGRGLHLEWAHWLPAFRRGEEGRIDIVVDDGDVPHEFTMRWDTDLEDPVVRERWAAVANVPRSERPVWISVRVERAQPADDGRTVQLRGREAAPE